jgi:hypothetical protein
MLVGRKQAREDNSHRHPDLKRYKLDTLMDVEYLPVNYIHAGKI